MEGKISPDLQSAKVVFTADSDAGVSFKTCHSSTKVLHNAINGTCEREGSN